jgi:prevent-host-death family protein
MKTIGAGKFKTTCLALLDHVEATREPITVTKNGRPVAQIIPAPLPEQDPIFGFYKGKIEILGDVVAPIYSDEENEAFLERSAELISPKETVR